MTSHKFNMAGVRIDSGYCYILMFSDGVVKVGRTIDLFKRYEDHRIDAKKNGISVSCIAFTDQHEAYKETEATIIRVLSERFVLARGSEYFSGVAFDDAASIMGVLPYGVTTATAIEKEGNDGRFKMVSLRVSDDELAAMEDAAKRERLKLGTWIKRAAMIDAERVNSQPLPENNPQSLPITPPDFEQ